MGKVYSPEQISSGNIPEAGAHEAAGQYALKELFPLTVPAETSPLPRLFDPDGPGVQSAMVYGSTAYGTAGIRSDLDILVFYDESQAHRALKHISSVFKQTEERFKVSVEANKLPVGAIYDDLEHGLDPLFAEHLLEIHDTFNGQWCRNNPTGGIERIAERAGNPAGVTALAHRYVSGRRNYFASTDLEGGVDYAVFQRALELPSAVGRKVVAATMGDEDEPLDLSNRPAMNDRALEALMAHMPKYDEEMVRNHESLYETDQKYSDLLANVIDGKNSIKDYTSWIEEKYLESIGMAYDLSQAWVDILRARKQKISKRIALAAASSSFDFNDPAVNFETDYAMTDEAQTPTSYN